MNILNNINHNKNFICIVSVALLICIILSSCQASSFDDEITVEGFLKSVQLGNMEKVEYFIENGIDIDSTNDKGQTALMITAASGQKDMLNLLINNGADVNLQDSMGKTALMHSAFSNTTWIAEELIKNNANINLYDKDGNTALMHSIYSKLMVYILVSAGADISIQNKDGQTVMDIAKEKNPEVAELLTDTENNPNYFSDNPIARPCIQYTIAPKYDDDRWKWETVFTETGGLVGYTLAGEGFAYDKDGNQYAEEGRQNITRGTIKVEAGGETSDSYWIRSTSRLIGGYVIFTWEGEDDLGNRIVMVEAVYLLGRDR